ncbi:hypothetical protein KSP39_PZI022259 [Platanthera zijinensis]|uniref:Uncharacterized protein n=1 Tax=Platanthera zijinensis TaxID=2320716 RepID=A0AAP0FUD4_9ASPA
MSKFPCTFFLFYELAICCTYWFMVSLFSLSSYLMYLNKKLNLDTQFGLCDSHVHLETNFLGAALSSSVIFGVDKKAPSSFQTSALDAQSTGRLRGSRLRKLQRKRNFLQVSSARNFSSMKRGRYIDDSFN